MPGDAQDQASADQRQLCRIWGVDQPNVSSSGCWAEMPFQADRCDAGCGGGGDDDTGPSLAQSTVASVWKNLTAWRWMDRMALVLDAVGDRTCPLGAVPAPCVSWSPWPVMPKSWSWCSDILPRAPRLPTRTPAQFFLSLVTFSLGLQPGSLDGREKMGSPASF